MLILHDPRCADYGSSLRPEQPARITATVPHLKTTHPAWTWRVPEAATEADVLRAHTAAHLKRLGQRPDFDEDTPFFPTIREHALRAAGAAILAAESALAGQPAFALMRPPGHHATRDQAMGFCYLNNIAIAALAARARGAGRIAVWDFDAHHGNGTEAILHGQNDFLFVSVHQSPGYPGTGTASFDNCRNFPIAPHTPREGHLAALADAWAEVLAFKPELVLVSAGFDAYVHDPITAMTLVRDDFATLGTWLHASRLPSAAVLEGGYSRDLPALTEAFVAAWAGEERGA
ncbi:MAG TPA: histone deacetylase [Opitutaceae bacterium]